MKEQDTKERKTAKELPKNQKVTVVTGDNYMTTGMCMGIGLGMAFAQFLGQELSIGMCIGVGIGMFVGALIKETISTASIGYLEYMAEDFSPDGEYLKETEYIDFSDLGIQQKANEIMAQVDESLGKDKSYQRMKPQKQQEVRKSKIAEAMFLFVRDEIPHSHDIRSEKTTTKASQVLKEGTGVCHAKSNLLAALLRYAGIPAGICLDHLTRGEDDSRGYLLHAFNAVWLDNEWTFMDARGNKEGVNAQFPKVDIELAFSHKEQYDEFYYYGILKDAHRPTMERLENAANLDEVWEELPDSM